LAAPCRTDNATGAAVPGWRYDAAATLDLGGSWVTVSAAPGRDPTSADLTVSLDGVVINSTEVALSRHPDSEGVCNLVFSAEYWARSLDTGNPNVSFAAGTFLLPTFGPLGAFSESVTLVDCLLPTVARGQLLYTDGYECAGASTCPSDGIWRAAFVLEVDFSEPVTRTDGGPVTDADLQIYTVGGVATVTGTYVVKSSGSARRRRLSEAAGTTQLLVAVELSSGATGFEVVHIQAIEGAICDRSGTWIVAHGDTEVVTAAGNVLQPFGAQLFSSNGASASPVSVVVPVGIVCAVLLVLIVLCLCYCRRRRRSKVEVRVGPRWGSLGAMLGHGSRAEPGTPKRQPVRPRSKAAPKPKPKRPHGKSPADVLAIAKQYAWLRAKEPHVELTARWIDTLADAAVDSLRGAQPSCALPPGVLKHAHAVHANLNGGCALDDLEALRALARLLRDEPQHLPESLLMAAASLDTSAAAAMGIFGEAEAMSSLQQVLTSGRAVPKAVALGLGDMDLPPASSGYEFEKDAALKQQLAGLLRQREWYAYALTSAQGLMPACLAAFASAGLDQPSVGTVTEAAALVVKIVEMHARLGARQREVETRTHRAVEAPYQAWVRAHRREGGFSDLENAPVASEVAQVRMRHHNESVSIFRWLQYKEGGLKYCIKVRKL